ncbi:MAG: DEAD/DEAH box helicase [Candidatus Scalindua sp.]|nr:DEAD/DEAH box helicase [Candidatus Scalindua sp.]
MKTFAKLGLSENVLRAVKDKGYQAPSPIQELAIPAILTGNDILAAAQTGTGKTAGFTLPMVQILDQAVSTRNHPIRALVLTPTRELAAQVQDSIKTYGKYLKLKSMVVFGGVNIKPQIDQLKKGVDILVATPGRLLDLCNQRACRLNEVNILVLDEADRMLDMGFIHDIRRIIKLLPPKRQNLLFSATFSKEIRTLTHEFLVKPITIEVTPEKTAAQTVSQRAYRCDAKAKTRLAIHLIKEGKWEQVLIFTRTKHGANRLCSKFSEAGIQSSTIHGNKTQTARIKALEDLKRRKIRVLVATDIAARGLDIVQLPHVVNYELSNVPEDYVHRIGRTGRAGMEGEAISLVCNDERPFLRSIEKLIGHSIDLSDVPGFEPSIWPKKAPSAGEVQKAAAVRKEAARLTRGPRRQPASARTSTRERNSAGNKPGRRLNQKRKLSGEKG